MLNLKAIRKTHDAPGALHRLLAPWGFVGEGVLLTKLGHLAIVFRCGGLDAEGLTDDTRAVVAARVTAALRMLGDDMRVYQYLVKTEATPPAPATARHPVVARALRARADYLAAQGVQYDLDRYLVLVYEGMTAPTTRTLSPAVEFAAMDVSLRAALDHLEETATAFALPLTDLLALTRCSADDAFRFLRRLVNYDGPAIRFTHRTHLDYWMADATVTRDRDAHGDCLHVGPARVRVLTLKDAPTITWPHALESLYTLPSECIACLEWRRLPIDTVRRDLNWRRRIWHSKREDAIAQAASRGPSAGLTSQSAGTMAEQLGAALTAIEVDGHIFGECSLSVVLHGRDPHALDRSAAEVRKALAAQDGVFHDESMNLLPAWLSIVPGNGAWNVRRLPLLDVNAADLAFLFAVEQGSRARAIVAFDTPSRVPFHLDPLVSDVGHTLVTGATGSGKSFLVNALVMHWHARVGDTVIFDLGHSYRRLADALDGSYVDLDPRGHTPLNPFAADLTPEHRQFLHGFCRLLMERGSPALTAAEDAELYEQIGNVYVMPRHLRRLATLRDQLPHALSRRLEPWCEGDDGRYARFFDHVDDGLRIARFQVFDLERMADYPVVLEPLLFYVLHRVQAVVLNRASWTICVMDEAWRFVQHPTFRAYVEQALKTWRKYYAAMILATQSVEDFARSGLQQTVLETCPTKWLLANPDRNRQQYAELFGLNERALDLFDELRPKGQALLVRPGVTKVLNVTVDPEAERLYSSAAVVEV